MISPLLGPVLRKDTLRRFFTKLDATSQSYYSINNGDGVLLGDQWKVQCTASTALATAVEHGWGGDEFGLRFDQDGSLRLILPRKDIGTTPRYPKFDTFTIQANKLYTITVERDFTDFTVTINGVSQTISFNDIDTSIPLYLVGAWYSTAGAISNFLDGYIFDFSIELAGTLAAKFILDTNIQTATFGSQGEADVSQPAQLVDLGYGFSSDSTSNGVVTNVDGVIDIVKTETSGETGWNYNALDDTKNYILYCDVEVVSGSGAAVARWTSDWQSLGSVVPFDKSGPISVDLPGTGRLRFRINTSNTGHVRFKNIRVYEVPNVIRAINVIPDDVHAFTQDDNYGWLGDELVINGSFNEGSLGWTFADGWSVVNGKAKRDGDASNDGIEQGDIFSQGNTYLLNVTSSGRTRGNLFAYIGQGTQSMGLNTAVDGNQVTKTTSTSTQTKLLLNGTNSFDGAVDDVSVKQLLEYGT